MQRDIELVQELYDAYTRRDHKALLMLLSTEVQIRMSPELPWGGVYRGKEGMKQALAAVAKHLDSRIVMERLIDAGAHVVCVGRNMGKAHATQLEFDIPVVHVWEVHEGQIVRLESYVDNATLLSVLGG
jgi:uncharacterized protein